MRRTTKFRKEAAEAADKIEVRFLNTGEMYSFKIYFLGKLVRFYVAVFM